MNEFTEQLAAFEKALSLCSTEERKSMEAIIELMVRESKKLPKPLGAVAIAIACIKMLEELTAKPATHLIDEIRNLEAEACKRGSGNL